MKKILPIIVIALTLISVIVWLGKKDKASNSVSNHKLNVVTTLFPLWDFTRMIASDTINLTNLLPPNQGPHDFSVTPDEAQKIAAADVLIINGVGDLEAWLPDLLANNKKRSLVIINTGEGAHLVESGATFQLTDGMELTETDPHIWLDPRNAIIQIDNIVRRLAKISPEQSDFYTYNADRIKLLIKDLENTYQEKLNNVPHKNFISFHNAFNHLSYRFGLNQVGVFEELPGQEPSPKELIAIINTIKKANIKVLFSEPQFSPKIVETVARDLGIRTLTLDPLDTGDFKESFYLPLMEANLDNLVAAFKL